MRPLRAGRAVVCVAVVLGVWWLVAHNSGAGWIQLIGDGLAAVLAVGLLGPAAVLRGATVRVASAPGDATAGLPAELLVVASTRVRVRPVSPEGPEGFIGPVRGRMVSKEGDQVTLLPWYRGVYRYVVLDVATAAPFALFWWSRRVTLAVPAELLVAPRLGPPAHIPHVIDESSGEGRPRGPATVGEPRGVRLYQPGDSRRWMHWPATAHAGALMVREMEAATAEPVTVTVDLPADLEAAERVAESALGTVTALLDRGIPVVLRTLDATGRVEAVVADRRQAGRQLARAVVGPDGAGDGVTIRPGAPR